MNRCSLYFAVVLCATLSAGRQVDAQSNSVASRMRPIGSSSAVDSYRQVQYGSSPAVVTVGTHFANSQRPVRQTAWMQSPGMALPTGPGTTIAPPNSVGAPLPSNPPYPTRPLPSPGSVGMQQRSTIVPSSSDYAPIPAPELNTQGYATVDNCRLVTQPTGYTGTMGYGCGQVAPTNYTSGGYAPVAPVAPAPAAPAPMTTMPVAQGPVTTSPITTPAPDSYRGACRTTRGSRRHRGPSAAGRSGKCCSRKTAMRMLLRQEQTASGRAGRSGPLGATEGIRSRGELLQLDTIFDAIVGSTTCGIRGKPLGFRDEFGLASWLNCRSNSPNQADVAELADALDSGSSPR